MHACITCSTQQQPGFAWNCVCISWLRCPLKCLFTAGGALRMLTHLCPFPGPPLPALPGGLQPMPSFTSQLSLRLSGSISVLLSPPGPVQPRMSKGGDQGQSRIKRDARESVSGGGRQVPALADRGGCRAPCHRARPSPGRGRPAPTRWG